MKKVIDGNTYDTEAAEELGYASNNRVSRRDFSFWEETLYQRKDGEYFLHGHGGPYTSYSRIVMGMQTGGEMIIPYSEGDAKKWVSEKLEPTEYEKIFGKAEE